MLRFTGIQSYSYMEHRKVETDVDRMTEIELATLQAQKAAHQTTELGVRLADSSQGIAPPQANNEQNSEANEAICTNKISNATYR